MVPEPIVKQPNRPVVDSPITSPPIKKVVPTRNALGERKDVDDSDQDGQPPKRRRAEPWLLECLKMFDSVARSS